MTYWFNRQCNIYEIYHNGRMVDHTKSLVEAIRKIEDYQRIGANIDHSESNVITIKQNKGKAHCRYIKQLAQDIWLKENNQPDNRLSWNDCIKKAMLFHVKELEGLIDENVSV